MRASPNLPSSARTGFPRLREEARAFFEQAQTQAFADFGDLDMHKDLYRRGQITRKEYEHLDKLKKSGVGYPLYRYLEREYKKRPVSKSRRYVLE